MPADELASAAQEWAAQLAAQTALAVTTIKRSLRHATDETFAEAIEREAVEQAACSASPEFREKLRARQR